MEIKTKDRFCEFYYFLDGPSQGSTGSKKSMAMTHGSIPLLFLFQRSQPDNTYTE
jgi:hypothetical protein